MHIEQRLDRLERSLRRYRVAAAVLALAAVAGWTAAPQDAAFKTVSAEKILLVGPDGLATEITPAGILTANQAGSAGVGWNADQMSITIRTGDESLIATPTAIGIIAGGKRLSAFSSSHLMIKSPKDESSAAISLNKENGDPFLSVKSATGQITVYGASGVVTK